MELLKKPIWLFFSTIIPQLLLVYFFYVAYDVIEGLLAEEKKDEWFWSATYYLLINAGFTIYAIYSLLKKKTISLQFTWLIFLIQILSLTIFFYVSDQLIPRNIPRWMLTSSDLEIYPYSLVIPGALHGLILLVLHYTKPATTTASSIIGAFVIPLSVFTAFQIGDFFSHNSNQGLKYISIYLLVFSVCLFLFFIFRIIYIVSKRKDRSIGFIARLFFCLVFPLVGLAFNNSMFGDMSGGVFGDFNNYWFYTVAIINGVFMLLPKSENFKTRFLQFIINSILFSYTLYFFFVFLPWLPLSILAIILVGFGFLMLTPILVFVLQIKDIKEDFSFLRSKFKQPILVALFFGSFLVIPAIITVNFSIDKHQLNTCLEYLNDRSYFEENQIEFDEDRVERLMDHIESMKNTHGHSVPFIDSYYNKVVLDNLLLSSAKIESIKSIILGDGETETKSFNRRWRTRWQFPANNGVLDNYNISSTYLPDSGYWKSNLELNIKTTSSGNVQYKAYIQTQPGTFITDYFLTIEGVDKPGILAEKRTARWVYNNIVKTRRDPGLLEKTAQDRFTLSIFPVSTDLPRKSGIEFIHKQPTSIRIDNQEILLGETKTENKQTTDFEDFVLLDGSHKKQLHPANRKQEFHLILNNSVNSNSALIEKNTKEIIKQLKGRNYTIGSQNYNYTPLHKNTWESEILTLAKSGGFFPEYQIKKILINNYVNESKLKPVVVLITDEIKNIKWLNGLSDLPPFAQEVSNIIVVDQIGANYLDIAKGGITPCTNVVNNIENGLLYRKGEHTWIVKDDNKTELLPLDKKFTGSATQSKNKYEKALSLKQMELKDDLHPDAEYWLPIVQESFRSRVISKYTSFLSLENESQEKMLLFKQGQVLNANKNLDLEEDVNNMSEPSIYWYLIVGFILLSYSIKKKRKLTTKF